MRFSCDIGGGFQLALRTIDTVKEVRALILRNLDRLREWEPWAQSEQTVESSFAFTRAQLADYLSGALVPTVILADGCVVGSASVRLNSYTGIAELGY